MRESDKLTFHVSLVVIPIDDFTGKPITGSNVRVYITGEKPPIVKAEGYRVFVNIQQPCVKVHCESGLYDPREDIVELKDQPLQMLKIRLSPNTSYPIPPDTTCVVGNTKPNAHLLLRSKTTESAYKLLYEYSHKEEKSKQYMEIYNPLKKELEGKLFYICSKDQTDWEYFKIRGFEQDKYILETPLQHEYKKIGTDIVPVYETYADKNGDFFLPISGKHGESMEYICQIDGQEECKEITLYSGKRNKIIL